MTAAHVDTGVRDSVMTSELGYPRYPTIIHALAKAAELNPAAPGLMCQERLLSYREYAHAVAIQDRARQRIGFVQVEPRGALLIHEGGQVGE